MQNELLKITRSIGRARLRRYLHKYREFATTAEFASYFADGKSLSKMLLLG